MTPIQQARQIAARHVTCPSFILEGKGDGWPEVKCAMDALAASPPKVESERKPPHGYTPETWAAKQAEVAEFSRRDPFDDPVGEGQANSEARLEKARDIQCADVPDQFALVRRGDLNRTLGELYRRRAGHELAIERRRTPAPVESGVVEKLAQEISAIVFKHLSWTKPEGKTFVMEYADKAAVAEIKTALLVLATSKEPSKGQLRAGLIAYGSTLHSSSRLERVRAIYLAMCAAQVGG